MQRVTLYSLTTCPVCKKVKEFLEENNIEYKLIELDTLDSGEQWLLTKEIAKYNPAKTFPTLIIEEAIIGYKPEELREKLLKLPD